MISEISNGISGRVYEIWQQLVTPCNYSGGIILSLIDYFYNGGIEDRGAARLMYLLSYTRTRGYQQH